jgi:ribosomal protein S18 acetylase RimI-like enzyme
VAVSTATVTIRRAGAGDQPLLRRVYAGSREAELSLIAWSDAEKKAFLDQQFDFQEAYYRGHYDGATYSVIEVDGGPVGRLYVARWPDEIRVIDIAVLPEHRGAGIGTRLLGELLDEAERTGKRVSIHVEKGNPAFRLYERLGFAVKEDKGLYLLLEASP